MSDGLFSQPADGISLITVDEDALTALAAQVLDPCGRQQPMPASVYAAHDQLTTIAALCVRHGIYGLVTHELVEFIHEHIAGRTAIEVGSGDGVLADALGITATDNYMQEWPDIATAYARMQQPVVKYGANVKRLDADVAVARYKPQVIVASWFTHKYKQSEHERGGNMYAPDELRLLKNCETLIFVGNTSAHARHRLLELPHVGYANYPEQWLYSRAVRGNNFIGVWQGGRKSSTGRPALY